MTQPELTELPTLGEEARTKPPLPSFVNTESVLSPPSAFAEIKSSLPSSFTSAAVTDLGYFPTANVALTLKVPLPLFVNTESVLSPEFAVINSTFPSPFRSAAMTEVGPLPTSTEEERVKTPPPLPVHTQTLLVERHAQTKSTLPSPFRSAATTESG
jgi:hypothetical protein